MAYRILEKRTVLSERLFEQAAVGINIASEVGSLSKLRGNGAEIDLHRLVEDLNVLLENSSQEELPAHEFEAWVGTTLHEHLRTETDATNDAEFWLWLSFGPLREIVSIRASYPGSSFTERLVGLGPMREGFLYRAFLRADLVFDPSAYPSQQYRHAFVGEQDFWRSHVIRLGYAMSREQLRAFVEFLYPGLRDTPLLAGGTHELGIRLFVKRLRRVSSTTSFVFLDSSTWVKLLENQASKVQWEPISALTKEGRVDLGRRSRFYKLHEKGVIQDIREVVANGQLEAYRVRTACLTSLEEPYRGSYL